MAKKLKDISIFSGKRYIRGSKSFKTKAAIQEYAKTQRTINNNYAVIDKNKDGYFVWIRNKPAKESVAKKSSIKKMVVPEEFKEKFNSIKKESDWLNKKNKKELVAIAQSQTRLDISHIKSEDIYTVRSYILEKKFTRKSLEKFYKYK